MRTIRSVALTGRRRWAAAIALALSVPLAIAACSNNSTPGNSNAKPISGGTATFALPPGGGPNSILPLNTITVYTNTNIFDFQYLMYRPLYWFGMNGKVKVNPSLSIADTPAFSNGGKTVTIRLKHWVWSDGQPITSRDVEFWINVLEANKTQWGGYVPGEFPDNIARASYPNASTVVLTFTKAYNSYWLLYNQLSEIIPIPQHEWDRTSATSAVGNNDLTAAGAQAVFKYLESQSKSLNTYTTNPLWRVVDGPWRISSYNASTGATSFVPNKRYSGPQRPRLARFTELPFTSEFAEVAALRTGQVDYGYLPVEDLPSAGSFKSSGDTVQAWPSWGIGYQGLNFTNPVTGPVFKQLYVRQALAHLIDQPAIVRHIMLGYGYPTYGPVPVVPASSFVDKYELSDPYPYSPGTAYSLLSAHGWKRNSAGIDVCVRPGTAASECGAGIPAGRQLSFNDQYSNGSTVLNEVMQTFRTDAAKAGIQINLTSAPFSEVYSSYAPCKTGQPCTWDMKDYSEGGDTFTYSPDFYPTGEIIFSSGLGGDYSSSTANALIADTQTASGLAPLYRYEDYIAAQLPYLWMPVTPSQVSVIAPNLHGTLPQDPDLEIYPENWYLTK